LLEAKELCLASFEVFVVENRDALEYDAHIQGSRRGINAYNAMYNVSSSIDMLGVWKDINVQRILDQVGVGSPCDRYTCRTHVYFAAGSLSE
jgi:hypothetical protein